MLPLMQDTKLVVVAGATGYLGGHVVDAMADAGFRIRALARNADKLGARAERCEQVFVAEATKPETLTGLCEGADVLFSSIGIRSFGRKPSFWDVDFGANMNLLKCAVDAGVEHMIFTSAVNGPKLRAKIAVAEARERVVDAIEESGLRYTILRPSGFFNDMRDYYGMAKRGTAWVIGDGSTRLNPIHGADLAAEAVRAVTDESCWDRGLELGGPDTFTNREIAELAFEVLGRPPNVRQVAPFVLSMLSTLTRPFNETASSFIRALAAFGEMDFVGRNVGTHHLRDFFEELRDAGE